MEPQEPERCSFVNHVGTSLIRAADTAYNGASASPDSAFPTPGTSGINDHRLNAFDGWRHGYPWWQDETQAGPASKLDRRM
jgi:hypothetical protein